MYVQDKYVVYKTLGAVKHTLHEMGTAMEPNSNAYQIGLHDVIREQVEVSYNWHVSSAVGRPGLTSSVEIDKWIIFTAATKKTLRNVTPMSLQTRLLHYL